MLLAIVCNPWQLHARSLSADEALARAKTFIDSTDRMRHNVPGQSRLATYTLISATPEIYVFNRGTGGFLIAAGDDRMDAVLGYVESGTFDTDSVPPGLKWLMESYTHAVKEYISYMDSMDSGLSSKAAECADDKGTLSDLYKQWDNIPQIMTTQWNQNSPYNDMCPYRFGARCVTGCVPTALAQVIKAIGYYKGRGSKTWGTDDRGDEIKFDYANTSFDFSIMPDKCDNLNLTPEKIKANKEVSKLMLACGLAVNTYYHPSSSSTMSTDAVNKALIGMFGFDYDNTRYCKRKDSKYTQVDWERIIYTELSLGRPVWYAGGGHAYVIDGYKSYGLYHLNWGWGGRYDGWFRLSTLNPSDDMNYTPDQEMCVCVPQGATPGWFPEVTPEVLGSISPNDDNTLNIIYSATAFIEDVMVGAIITDEDENVLKTRNFFNAINNLTSHTTPHLENYSPDWISELGLKPGTYRFYFGYHFDRQDEWYKATPYNEMPKYLSLTIDAAGNYSFAITAKSDLFLADVKLPDRCYSGSPVSVELWLVNEMSRDWSGNVFVDILDENGTALSTSAPATFSVYSGSNFGNISSLNLGKSDGSPIEPGTYMLKIRTQNGLRLDDGGISMSVIAPENDDLNKGNLYVSNISSVPDILTAGYWLWTPLVECTESQRVRLAISFYEHGTDKILHSYGLGEKFIEGSSTAIYFDTGRLVTVDLPFGIYDAAYTNNGKRVSGLKTVKVLGNVDGISYKPISVDEVEVINSQGKEYTGHLLIPSHITLNGTTFSVTHIAPETFMASSELLSVEIPASVTGIGVNAFAFCTSTLGQIIIHGEEPLFEHVALIAQGLSNTTDFYVQPKAWDRYSRLREEFNVYPMIESIGSANVTLENESAMAFLPVTPWHDGINKNFIVASAFETSDADGAVADVEITDVADGHVALKVTPLRKGKQIFTVATPQRGVESAYLTVEVSDMTSGLDGIISDNGNSAETVVYNMMGTVVRKSDRLSPGIYIIVKGNERHKVLVK